MNDNFIFILGNEFYYWSSILQPKWDFGHLPIQYSYFVSLHVASGILRNPSSVPGLIETGRDSHAIAAPKYLAAVLPNSLLLGKSSVADRRVIKTLNSKILIRGKNTVGDAI
jgi:hypothetical protein